MAKAIEAASCGGDEEAASAANERKAAAEQVRLACLVNMAACQLRLGEHGAAAKSCSAALDIAPGSAKVPARGRHSLQRVRDASVTRPQALFRRGQARLALAELSGAKEDLLAAAKARASPPALASFQPTRGGLPPRPRARSLSLSLPLSPPAPDIS